MKTIFKYIIIVLVTFICNMNMVLGSSSVLADIASSLIHEFEEDTNNTEYWRKLGFAEKENGNFKTSVELYKKVLAIDNNDYDARLAVARLYYVLKEFDLSIENFQVIYDNDKTDVEAMLGFGRAYYKKKDFKKSIHFYSLVIKHLPDYVPTYFDLALVYRANNDLDSAIIAYQQVLKIDSTYAEAWSGIGKMMYWKGFPKSALVYYEKAVELDPENIELVKYYNKIKSELQYMVSASLHIINEKEEIYNIDAIIQKYRINKRFTDHFSISLNPLIDYSKRKYNDSTAEEKWFDNTWLKVTYLTPHNNISGFLGVSSSENQLTSYGLSWDFNSSISSVKIKNSATIAYDYFYYWNKAGHDFFMDNIRFIYKRFTVDGMYRYAMVRKNFIWDYETKDENPNQLYNINIKYEVVKNPKISIGYNYNYRNYENQSPLYYTPYERSISGFLFSSYYSFKKFYKYIEFSYGEDNYKIVNWTGSFEFGITDNRYSFSIGANRYYNEYYENYNMFLAIRLNI